VIRYLTNSIQTSSDTETPVYLKNYYNSEAEISDQASLKVLQLIIGHNWTLATRNLIFQILTNFRINHLESNAEDSFFHLQGKVDPG